jgi:hypothetical protein
VTAELREAVGSATLLGPADRREGVRWLIQGPDLFEFREVLRGLAQRWRDAGVVMRIDVDPIDL